MANIYTHVRVIDRYDIAMSYGETLVLSAFSVLNHRSKILVAAHLVCR